MNRLSIRLRMTIWYAVSLIALLILFGGLIDALMHKLLLSRTDFELEEELQELVLEIELASDGTQLAQQLDLRFSNHPAFEFQVMTPAGERVFTSRGIRPSSLPPSENANARQPTFQQIWSPELGDSRIVSREVASSLGPLRVQVIASLHRHLAELRDLRRLMFAVGPAVTLIAIAGGYWLAGRLLRPIDRMRETADRITALRLNERLRIPNPHDELGKLASTFNAMFDRLQRSFDELRQFTADAAHEFRTPLAVIRSSAELALRSPREEEYYRECLLAIAEEADRLTSLSNQLLTLAREDAGLNGAAAERVSLGCVLEQVMVDLEPLAEDRSLTMERLGTAPDVRVLGESHGLRRVFLNLLDNAIKFTPSGGHVSINMAASNDYAIVTVTDNGPGIAETHLPRLFERFYRVDPSRNRTSGGAGLGLAISQAIVTRHGGTIRLSNCQGGGTAAEVRLPISLA